MNNNNKILVTGAGGFIGGRIVEAIYMQGEDSVLAGIRQWGSAARVGRFPLEFALCDILNPQQIDLAMRGVNRVIHCAVGPKEVVVEGTRNVLEAALRHKVSSFVHVSTVDVYGDATGKVTEEVPCKYMDRPYGDAKIDAENVCKEYITKGLPVSIVRPSVVYGPFSKLWTVRFALRILSGNWGSFDGYGEGKCNLVYIDDLVRGILLASKHEKSVGETFNLNGSEVITWNQYFARLNAALGCPPLKKINVNQSRTKAFLVEPVRKMAKIVLGSYGKQVMTLYSRYSLAKQVMKEGEMLLTTTPPMSELGLYSKDVEYDIHKAQEYLGYKPQVTVSDGIDMSVRWLRHDVIASSSGVK